MKKKLLVLVALTLLVTICVTMLTGCDEIIKRNDQRDAQQIAATVTYTGNFGTQTDYVYKYEVANSFNSYAYYYVYYYSYTYEEAATYITKSLAQQKLLRLYAKDKVSQMLGKSAIPADIKELLSSSEINKATKETNDSMLSSLQSLIEEAITEDNYNRADTTTTEDEETVEVTTPIYVRFNANGGSSVDRQKIQNDTKAEEPEAPTKDGYTFVGWYTDEALTEEFDFDTKINLTIPSNSSLIPTKTLYAKWAKYVEPRTVKEATEEDEDKDYDPDDNTVEVTVQFFSQAYYDKYLTETSELEDGTLFKDSECFDDMKYEDGQFSKVFKEYVDDAIADLKKNTQANLYLDSAQAVYDYYLNEQLESLLVTRLERMITADVTVSKAEVEAEFARALNANKETFSASESSYESALGDSLASTYYHDLTIIDNGIDPAYVSSYGFVSNILLKLDDENLEILTNAISADPSKKADLTKLRNTLLSEISVKVSNPDYDAEAVIEDADGKEIEVFDAMMDPANPYNNVKTIDKDGKVSAYKDTYDKSYEFEVSDGVYENNYSQILSFEYKDGKWQICYNATEHPAMAYLLNEVPAFDDGTTIGIIHQIYNSFDQIKQAVSDPTNPISTTQSIYYLREMANAWLYLVGDDSGAVSSDNNNGGLGYLITPEEADSSYLADFTDYARALIKQGTGSFATETAVAGSFDKCAISGTDAGELAGNFRFYVAADSMIESGSTSGYAGIFVLLNTCTVWDVNAVTCKGIDGAGVPVDLDTETAVTLDQTTGELPMNYITTYAEDVEDCKSIYETIYDSLLDTKKEDKYNVTVNTMGLEWSQKIVYNEKAVESIYKDLE